jgi:enoyl-CoA hydratase/carnithine racemase
MDEALLSAVKPGIALIELNRPEKRNAANVAMRAGIIAALKSDVVAESNVVIMRGRGSCFCGGVDLKEIGLVEDESDDVRIELLTSFRSCPAIIVAAVHGFALGLGSGLAMAADIVLAGDDAVLGYPEIEHGLVAGVTFMGLREAIGSRRALELVLTGRRVSAAQAFELGMINEVVPAASLESRSMEIAGRLAGFARVPLHAMKRIAIESSEMAYGDALRMGVGYVRAMRNQFGSS